MGGRQTFTYFRYHDAMPLFVDMAKVWEVLGLGPGPTEYMTSPFAVEECQQRILAEVDPPLTLFGDSRFIGFKNNHEIVLRRRSNPRSQAGFEIALSISSADECAELRCQLRPSAFINRAASSWFGLLALFTGYAAFYTALKILDRADITEVGSGFVIVIAGLGMAFLGSRILRFMRWRANADWIAVLAVVRDATSA